MRSWALGTVGIWIALAVAVSISAGRPLPRLSQRERRTFTALALTAWAVQLTHFSEELLTGFFAAFPATLGLSPWSRVSFVAFNAFWLAVWALAAFAAPRGRRFAEWPLWFLALALVVNGLAHPLLAVRAGGYFPGLITSVPAFIAGGILLRWMARTTARPAEPHPA